MKSFVTGLGICLLVGTAISAAPARADGKFTCKNAESPFATELTIKGAGINAMIHITDPTLSGDLSYNGQMTAAGSSLGAKPGSLAYTGTIQNLTVTPPADIVGVIFVDPGVVNGGSGDLFRPTEEGFITFTCQAN